jgi:hypothetical protein
MIIKAGFPVQKGKFMRDANEAQCIQANYVTIFAIDSDIETIEGNTFCTSDQKLFSLDLSG